MKFTRGWQYRRWLWNVVARSETVEMRLTVEKIGWQFIGVTRTDIKTTTSHAF